MLSNNKTRLLFYCQSLVGIGHLTASLTVIRELLKDFDVDLIYGGQPIDINLAHAGFRVLILPTLLIDEKSGELCTSEPDVSINLTWHLRNEKIASFLQPQYAAAIVEFFPFGRRKFKKEINALFTRLRETNAAIPIFSFVREVLVPGSLEDEQIMVSAINKDIHTVFVRGDPNVITLDETFASAKRIAHKICYLGYLGVPLPPTIPIRANKILVSQGGGNVGITLLASAVQTAALLPDYEVVIATGTRADPENLNHLRSLIRSDNVQIVPFLSNFRHHLLSAALSINMGGDNTLLDVIVTQTPSLAFPYPGNVEQTIRIEKLSHHGWVSLLKEADLNPQGLKQQILNTINKPYPTTQINLEGAINLRLKIKAILAG